MGTFKTLFSSEDGKHKTRIVEYSCGEIKEKFKIVADYDAKNPEFSVHALRDTGWIELATKFEFSKNPEDFGTWAIVIRDNNIEPYKLYIEIATAWIDAVFNIESTTEKKKPRKKKEE